MTGAIGSGPGISAGYGMNSARPKPPRPEEMIKDLDVDGNGTLNSEEYAKIAEKHGDLSADKIEEMFAETDSDGDGEITQAEIEEVHRNRRPPQSPPMAQGGSFMKDLQSAVDSNDDDAIKALLDQLKSSSTYSGNESETTSLLLDIQA